MNPMYEAERDEYRSARRALTEWDYAATERTYHQERAGTHGDRDDAQGEW
ncbi:hypothetical protein [Mycolicibacterium fortuitum]|nr:hypothetical protein [Mycolicibacterium fortuitum]